MKQQSLFTDREGLVATAPPKTPRERFAEFHADNPHVYRMLRSKALELKRAGRERFGMRCLWESMRFDMAVETETHDFKLNDHYPPAYSRLLMQREPELSGFFETRGDGC